MQVRIYYDSLWYQNQSSSAAFYHVHLYSSLCHHVQGYASRIVEFVTFRFSAPETSQSRPYPDRIAAMIGDNRAQGNRQGSMGLHQAIEQRPDKLMRYGRTLQQQLLLWMQSCGACLVGRSSKLNSMMKQGDDPEQYQGLPTSHNYIRQLVVGGGFLSKSVNPVTDELSECAFFDTSCNRIEVD